MALTAGHWALMPHAPRLKALAAGLRALGSALMPHVTGLWALGSGLWAPGLSPPYRPRPHPAIVVHLQPESTVKHLFLIAAGVLGTTGCLAGQKPLPPEQQIALAVLPLPAAMRKDASVLGYDRGGKLVTLRKGPGVMTCLATDPADVKIFHVACYANSMEPFMTRGRELRAQGTDAHKVDSIRFDESKSGKIPLPKQGAALWMLTGPWSGVDVKAASVTAAVKPMYVVYMPYATSASIGVPDQPVMNGPWLMDPGTPKAHMMFMPSMNP